MPPETTLRPARVVRLVRGMAASDGAGVTLTRVIGTSALPDLDPFLMLDAFGTERAEDSIAGFPEHPHRGFETVTYMLDGRMRHRDNLGNEGVLVPGSVQWMTAARGLVHSEMPEPESGRMRGFQLWVNLPARDKMGPPRYQEFAPDRIPVATPAPGVTVKVIAGQVTDADRRVVRGPIAQPATEPLYLDIQFDAGAAWDHALPGGHSAFAYVFEGRVSIGAGDAAREVAIQQMAVLGDGTALHLQSGTQAARLLLVAARPLREPVVRHGPFVMNTREELIQAFADFQDGAL